jgi:caffeoyl-CoA O-methyltransferase
VLLYVERTHAAHDSALAAAFATPGEAGIPAIQVGPSEGKLLGVLLSLVQARKVVEIGTLAGYSALRMLQGMGPTGHLWTLEADPKHHALAVANIARAGCADRVTCVLGKALEHLDALGREHGPFDAVFIDADKGNYDQYGRFAAAHLRRGGLLLGDNAFFFGRLLEDNHPEAAAMRRFHEEAAVHFDTVCIPTPDGLLLGVKR